MGFGSSKCTSTARLDGKTAVVTGANTGIGKVTVQDFYLRGARVIAACRDLKKAEEAVDEIKATCKDKTNLGTIIITELDLSKLKSVRECANRLSNEERIDILVNNAGVICSHTKTDDGFELQMGTNHLGHFLLTLLLLPTICKSGTARIVNVSSMAHKGNRIDLKDLNWEKKTYNRFQAYQQSKLANILFTRELARKLKENNIPEVTTYSLHPGVTKTEIVRHFDELNRCYSWLFRHVGWFFKTPEQGAQTTIYCSVDEHCAKETGLYYAECAVKAPHIVALNDDDAKHLWELSWKLVGLDDNYNPFSR